ncbi:unnamed protein product [Hermetia illucens]|uniref:Kinesin-like protein n=2 Tax=Hermetia illucens TaxID=343691 RepID=A0A7R8UIP3_HERIL|nr:unnamed protein product [Hermetia illucens]
MQPKVVRNFSNSSADRTPVQVFCRVRPMQSEKDLTCIEIKSSTTVAFKPPPMSVGYRLNVNKETHYVFKHVFPGNSTQREVFTTVAEPLVEDLIRGKDGLLFTYGVTGSGKTFTMTGNTKDRGIMPRCLDALFKTISGYQSKKFVFKPDRLNGFEVQSEADAMLERQHEMNSRFTKPRRQDSDPEIASQASNNTKILDGVDEDNMYAVFITYIEIYNNSVYDLLEEGSIQRTLQSKIIREDSVRNMYVHGVTEIEVKSFEEAIEVFQTGQKRKRMGHTILNAESSRSHSVFTIRLVQAPTDMNGENVLQGRNMINVSQLSLVDLAGSERTNRTKNSGQRLREAGNINNSLMTLRSCLEYLRENQLTGVKRKVPYRDSKITHLFKKYFEGEGQVNMIVCVNPRAEDCDETVCVLKFAEMSQEVQTTKSTPAKFDSGLTPGRRKANKIFKVIENDLDTPRIRKIDLNLNSGLIYSLGSKFPEYSLNIQDGENLFLELMQHLRQRIDKRAVLVKDFNARCEDFRNRLLHVEKENISLKTELSSSNAMLNQERGQLNAIKSKAIVYENSLDELNRKMHEREELIKSLQKQLNQKQCLLNQKEIERERQKKKYTTKIAMETDKMHRKLESKLREQENKQLEAMRMKDEKLRLVSNILNADNLDGLPQIGRSASFENLTTPKTATAVESTNQVLYTPRVHRGVPVANARHRRSRSAGDKWLEHRAKNPVPLDTILQPYLKNRKSVTKLTDVKDVANQKTSKYCLISQEADTDGELETKLYKGNVIPTCGGGAQVIFNDVECLKQVSPNTSPNRKRPSATIAPSDVPMQDVASKCTVSIEGHSSKRPKV